MESYKSKTSNYNHKIFARSKTNIAPNCKKHPKHKQSLGVCSLCLNEKLFQISNNGNYSRQKVKNNPASSSSSDISSLSSSNPSSCSSPVVKHAGRTDYDALKSFKVYGRNALKKSRSMAFGFRSRKEEKGTKSGFWSKLLMGKKKGLLHSRTTTEKGSLQFAAVRIKLVGPGQI